MKRFGRYFIQLGILFAHWVAPVAFAQGFPASSRTLSTALPAIRVTANVEVWKGVPCLYDVSAYGWGVENACPSEVLHAVTVHLADQRQIVPLSAFADLAEPRSAKLIGNSQKSFTLVITGGDAATSYTAYLRFNGTGLVSRKVQSGEFPAESNEATTYKFNLETK